MPDVLRSERFSAPCLTLRASLHIIISMKTFLQADLIGGYLSRLKSDSLQIGIVSLLCGCGVISPQNPEAAIHEAAARGNAATVTEILEKKTSLVNHKNTKKFARQRTPLHEAANRAVAEALVVKGANIQAKDEFNWTPLHTVNNGKTAEFLIAKGADVRARAMRQFTPLHVISNASTAEVLLRHGADVNSEADNKMTPLEWQILENNSAVVEVLLKHGASTQLNRRDKKTYLHFAGDRNNPETVRLLLARGLDINATDNLGATPLHYAVYKDRTNVASELLNRGADPNHCLSRDAVIQTFRGSALPKETSIAEFTPLRLAKSEEMKALLRKHGARE